MKKTSYQAGAAHIAAIVAIVAILIGALVWVYWQNYSKDSQPTEQNQTMNDVKKNQSSETKVTYLDVCSGSERICYTYPSNWKLSQDTAPDALTEGESSKDEDTITSPSGEIVLTMQAGPSQVGGVCGGLDGIYSYTLENHTTKVQSLLDGKTSDVYAVKAIFMSKDKKYVPAVLLTATKELIKLGKHKPCSVGYADLLHKKSIQPALTKDNILVSVLFSSGEFLDVMARPSNKNSYPTYDAAKTVLSSEEYAQAYEILKSVNY